MSDVGLPIERWRGRYHDGLSAVGHAVEIRLGVVGLEILGADGKPIAEWRYDTLVAVDRVRRDLPAVLTRGADDDARLTLGEPRRYDALLARAPQLAAWQVAKAARGVGKVALGLGAVAAVVAALWFGWPRLADVLAAATPTKIEALMGAQARSQMIHLGRACDNGPAQDVLVRLLARLTAAAHYEPPVTITVIDVPIVNALALPGDQVVVFRQLIAEAQSPEELAGVLAHELGHLAAHHPMRNLVRQSGLGLIMMALSGNSNWDGVAQILLGSHYSREFEAEADQRALDTLAAASIGGQGWIDFFDRLARAAGSGSTRLDRAAAYLSDHPPSAERRDLAARLPATGQSVMSAGDWLVLKSICKK